MSLETCTIAIEDGGKRELELVERHRHGDASAFEELYAEHSAAVYRLCKRLAGDADEAFDLAQEVFLRVYKHLGRFRGRSTLRTWIYRVTLNVCRSRLARRRRDIEPLETAFRGGAEPPAPGDSPESLAAAAEQERRILAALARLSLRFRVAVVLRDVEGLAYAEIAAVLRLPIGTVRSRIARGRESLRADLERSR